MRGLQGLVAAAVLTALLVALVSSGAGLRAYRRVRMYVYGAARDTQRLLLERKVSSMQTLRREHVVVRFAERDAMGEEIADQAEAAYLFVAQKLGRDPRHEELRPVTVVVYPSFQALEEEFPVSAGSVGVYWAGVVAMVSPFGWGETFGKGETEDLFLMYNPLAHEMTHYVLDYMAGGNYPRWFSEGLAQLAESEWNGYVLDGGRRIGSGDYPIRALENAFDRLSDANAAYLKSFDLVKLIESAVEERGGSGGIQRIVACLMYGNDLQEALKRLGGVDYDALEQRLSARPGLPVKDRYESSLKERGKG